MSNAPTKEFWNERYREGRTPWDYGRVPAEWDDFLRRQAGSLRLLVPGCGSGYEIAGAVRRGHDAIGIDLSEEAVIRARAGLGGDADRVLAGDFFEHPFPEESFDGVYERTFLCALPPELRAVYVDRMRFLLKDGGVLAGYFLYGEEADPPPYPLANGEDARLIGPYFELIESRPSREPLALFEGRERWQVWRKR